MKISIVRKVITFLAMVLFTTTLTFAQADKAYISGTVYDQNKEPLPSASVAVYDSTTSDIVTGAASAADGAFTIDLEPGHYVLRVTFLSFGTHTEAFEIAPGETKDFGSIIMEPKGNMLGELEVRGERSEMEMDFDRRVFNVGKDITSLGGSAVNVLDKVPSVSTDIDGNISLRGNESVRVLINGKPSSMVSNGVNALRSIPANMIKKVEVITNPSSKYAAEGSAGIINIVLRKDRRLGLNGTASAGIGYPENYEGSLNINYRRGIVNWFANGGLNYRSHPMEGNSFQRFASPDTTYMYSQNTDHDRDGLNGNLRLGADIHLSENEVLTASTYLRLDRGNSDQIRNYTDMAYDSDATNGNGSDILQRIKRSNDESRKRRNYNLKLRYDNKIDGNDHKLSAYASFDIRRNDEDTDIEETILQGSKDPLIQRSNSSEDEENFLFNIDYKRPLGENGKLEAGLRTETKWRDSGYDASTLINDTWIEEAEYDQKFLYMENVNAAFAEIGYEFGNFSTQLGLRAENTNIRTELKKAEDVNKQHYMNLFPSVFVNYSITDMQSVQASYSRRLRRPWSRALVPLMNIDDLRSQRVGNAELKPEFSNSFELGYLYHWSSGSVLASLYYRHRTNVIERITQIDSVNNAVMQTRKPINLGREKAWGLELSVDQQIADKLTLSGNANFFKSNKNGTYQSDAYSEPSVFDSEAKSIRARTRLQWKLLDRLNIQASLRYRGPSDIPQGRRNGMLMTDSGISYDIMNEKAKISLNVRDIFDSQKFSNTITTDNNPRTEDFYSYNDFSWSTRSFSLNFQYFFGDTQKKNHRPNRSQPRDDGGMRGRQF